MRLLIVGTLKGQLSIATKMAVEKGAAVTNAEDVETALRVMRAKGADLVMIDVAVDVRQLVQAFADEMIAVPVVACGTSNDARAAVAAIHAGAKEYIPLPPDPELIAAVLAAVADDAKQLIYRDEAMARVVQLANQVAASEASILITGESGTGKEVLARYVHAKSNRAKAPFVAVNCAAIPDNLLESELFGHEKGAFTGAVARRVGKFEEANGGTLLLDEISEMDIRLQSKLLRAIQERVIDRVGGTRPVPVDIRILATSNRNLSEEVRKGTFREDLLYRLNVVNLKLPPLRERPRHPRTRRPFRQEICRGQRHAAEGALGRGAPAADRRPLAGQCPRAREHAAPRRAALDGSRDRCRRHPHPDGARLDERRGPDAVAAQAAIAAEAVTRGLVGRTVADVERDLILDTLGHTLGNRTHAANILGISIRTLRNKLNQYADEGHAIPPPPQGEARYEARYG